LPSDPDIQIERRSETTDLEVLADMVLLGLDLKRDQVSAVLNDARLVVVADDESLLRILVLRTLARERDPKSILTLDGNMQGCFDNLPDKESGQLPFIMCSDGHQARLATQTVCERQIQNAIMIYDQKMGGPTGLEVFKEFSGSLPASSIRALHSGTVPPDAYEHFEAGALDAIIEKPSLPNEIRTEVARAYLMRILEGSTPSLSRQVLLSLIRG